jgi:hypothetical protein
MSFKSKNLHYERSEPAFLRRIRGELVGSTDDQTNSVPLPKKPKRLELGDDEGPTYVLEDSGETVTKEVFEKMIAKNNEGEERSAVADADEKQQDNGVQNENNDGINRYKQQVAQIGALSKKRKIVKIVGESPDSDDGAERASSSKASSKRNVQKPKKKVKQVKLTFDDDKEEGG